MRQTERDFKESWHANRQLASTKVSAKDFAEKTFVTLHRSILCSLLNMPDLSSMRCFLIHLTLRSPDPFRDLSQNNAPALSDLCANLHAIRADASSGLERRSWGRFGAIEWVTMFPVIENILIG
jgi:hypothetical protein